MKLLSILAGAALCCALLTGCATAPKPNPGPLLVELAVQAGTSYGIEQHPEAVPYLRAAAPVICTAADTGTVNPADVVAAIQAANLDALSTPDAKLILNAALVIYDAAFSQYSATEDMKPYLKAVCNGLTLALPTATRIPARIDFPRVK